MPPNTPGALVARTAQVLASEPRSFALVYTGDLDGTGHACGCTSAAWPYQLAQVDLLARQLADALPAGTPLYVTADHGMVDVPAADRVDADQVTGLRTGVALLGGEPRARHVYGAPGAAADVLAAWQQILAGRAWVVSREQAIDEGWFGPVDRRVTDAAGRRDRRAAGDFGGDRQRRRAARVGPDRDARLLAASDQEIPLLSCVAG